MLLHLLLAAVAWFCSAYTVMLMLLLQLSTSEVRWSHRIEKLTMANQRLLTTSQFFLVGGAFYADFLPKKYDFANKFGQKLHWLNRGLPITGSQAKKFVSNMPKIAHWRVAGMVLTVGRYDTMKGAVLYCTVLYWWWGHPRPGLIIQRWEPGEACHDPDQHSHVTIIYKTLQASIVF